MAIGSEQRRREREPRIAAVFARRDVETALDLLHLTDMAWHDCYGPGALEIPPDVLDDILFLAGGFLAGGDLAALIRIARQAVLDFRDVRVAADDGRARRE